MKFDRQIVAIALVSGASVLYSDDVAVAKFAAGCGLTVKRVVDLPIPVKQGSLEFTEAEAPSPSTSEGGNAESSGEEPQLDAD